MTMADEQRWTGEPAEPAMPPPAGGGGPRGPYLSLRGEGTPTLGADSSHTLEARGEPE